MIELENQEKEFNTIYQGNNIPNKFSIETEIFDIGCFISNVNNFNLTFNEGNLSKINESVDIIIDQLVQSKDSGTDPDIIEEQGFDFSKFYLNCIECLKLNSNDLDVKIIYMLGHLASLSTEVSDTFLENNVLENLINFFMDKALPTENLIGFFYFISKVSLNSVEGRELMVHLGIFNFFISVLQSCPDFQVYIADLECIFNFFSYEEFTKISESPHFNQLLISLGQIINNIISKQFDPKYDESSCISISIYIMNIFNVYLGADRDSEVNLSETCTHFLELGIPSSFINFFNSDLSKEFKDIIAYPIISSINQIFLFANNDLIPEFSSNFNLNTFIHFCGSEDPRTCFKSLCIIERLINRYPDNISYLIKINFYNDIITIMENSGFQTQKQIINIILETIVNATSSEIIQFFANDTFVNYLIDFIDIPGYQRSKLIPDTLIKICEYIPPDDQLYYTISQALESLTI